MLMVYGYCPRHFWKKLGRWKAAGDCIVFRQMPRLFRRLSSGQRQRHPMAPSDSGDDLELSPSAATSRSCPPGAFPGHWKNGS
jgi:hypothetical protein